MWHEALKEARSDGDVEFLGVIQEQHPERCRLFAQWKEFEWPIVLDRFNLLPLRAVPLIVAIDEHGIVRQIRPGLNEVASSFVSETFPPPESVESPLKSEPADITQLRALAKSNDSATTWRDLGDALLLWGGAENINEAIIAYRKASSKDPDSAELHFRLGVALRWRYEINVAARNRERQTSTSTVSPSIGGSDDGSGDRHMVDFQDAVRHWDAALAIDPNHYIYRRRIQQYGPRLTKPYPFYDWVETARRAITARGLTPIALPIEPSGAELIAPAKEFAETESKSRSPDPQGRIDRDLQRLVRVSSVVVPSRATPGSTVRVHVGFRLSDAAHWNNEAEPLIAWVNVPDDWKTRNPLRRTALPKATESHEPRTLEFEVKVPNNATDGLLKAYALYYVCAESGGQCLYLRQDFDIPVLIAEQ